jgi:predicted NBD/HSP70 family sugar kinase
VSVPARAATAGEPAATEQLRRHNTGLVLSALREAGPGSRAALAQRTGLAKATVGAIVATLLQGRYVAEDAPVVASHGHQQGRPGRPVRLTGASTVAVGVEVNVDYLAVSALDLAGRSIVTEEHLPRPGVDMLDALGAVVVDAYERLIRMGCTVLGVSVAVPGLVDRDAGVVVAAPNLRWHDLALAERVSELLAHACPVHIDNDANCAARAEVDHGAARGVTDMLYLTGTVGLGCGLVLGGQVYRGRSGFAGEVGHMQLGAPDAPCACGRFGCWEASVGLHALLRAAGRLGGQLAGSGADSLDPVDVARDVAAAARVDPRVEAGVRQLAGWLGTGVATLVNTLNPQMVVLGGSFVPLGEWLVPAVQGAIRERVLADRAACEVTLSSLALHAASDGAASDVLSDVYAGRLALA